MAQIKEIDWGEFHTKKDTKERCILQKPTSGYINGVWVEGIVLVSFKKSEKYWIALEDFHKEFEKEGGKSE